MKRSNLLGAAVFTLGAGAATLAGAQEFTQDWEGFYAGIHLDGTAYSVAVSDLNDSFLNESPQQSFLLGQGGITGGYNYALDGNLLISAELDFSSELAIDNFFSSNESDTTGLQYDLRLENVLQLRARAGFTQGNALGYMTIGVAQATPAFETYAVDTDDGRVSCDTSNCAQTSESLLGLSVGGGIDWAFRENWIGRVEVQHMVFESIQAPVRQTDETPLCASGDTDQCTLSYEPETTSIRFGISYMF